MTPGARGSGATPRDRLSRAERREHLLDVTAELVLGGDTAISMESLARAAGVSKTLPYKHFDNVTAVLAALAEREALRLAGMIAEALQAAGPDDDLAEVWLNAYFDALSSHGAVLQKLHTPGADLVRMIDPTGRAVDAVALVLREFLGVEPGRADQMSRMVHGAIVGAALSWVNGEAPREDLQEVLIALIQAIRAPDQAGR